MTDTTLTPRDVTVADLTLEEKASLTSGGELLDDQVGRAGRHSRRDAHRRSARAAQAGRLGRPPRPRRERAGHVLPAGGRSRRVVGCRSRRARGRGARSGVGDRERRRAARSRHRTSSARRCAAATSSTSPKTPSSRGCWPRRWCAASSRRASVRRSSTSPRTTRRTTACAPRATSTSGRCARSTCADSSGSSQDAQPWTVMCAYNRINGVYASEDPWLLTQVLRGEWGFEGLVVSDWGAVNERIPSVAVGHGPRDADLQRAHRRAARRGRAGRLARRGRARCRGRSRDRPRAQVAGDGRVDHRSARRRRAPRAGP